MKKYIFLILTLTLLVTSCSIDTQDTSEQPLYIGMMVHLEGWSNEATDQSTFENHAESVRLFADYFEEYDAKATFETRPEFVDGCNNWDDNVIKELYERGHDIGVHADLGGQADINEAYYEFMITQLIEMKTKTETLLEEEVRHVSGICSTVDWVTAAIEAGYEFTSGGVAYCVMSMPEESRPEEFRYCESAGACHDTFPIELADRLHPWRMDSGENWLEHSDNGQLVMLSSSSVFYTLDEEAAGELPEGAKGTLEQTDVDEFFVQLDQALELKDPNQVNILYTAWSIGNKARITDNKDLFDEFFTRLQPYIDSGEVEWKTLPEMYDLYLEWEQQ
jgi:hypothetical protein